jgi:hypothetical protein
MSNRSRKTKKRPTIVRRKQHNKPAQPTKTKEGMALLSHRARNRLGYRDVSKVTGLAPETIRRFEMGHKCDPATAELIRLYLERSTGKTVA